jgi:uncharacterized protein YabE (DUF348 family)
MECLHTFCHECIVKVVQPGKPSNACPKCAIALGNNPFVEKKIVRDGTKTSIVDKIRRRGTSGGSSRLRRRPMLRRRSKGEGCR